MIKNYLKVIAQNFFRQKTVYLINIFGYAVGIAALFLIAIFVAFERSYDTFHENLENIYRVRFDRYEKGELTAQCAVTYPIVGPTMKADFPEVVAFTRLFHIDKIVTISHNDVRFNEQNVFCADSSFFSIFSFPLVKGEKTRVLAEPNSIVLSVSAARKFFRGNDPIGEMVTFNDGNVEVPFLVTGIFEDVPENSHFKFDFLISYKTLTKFVGNGAETSWSWAQFYTYILLLPQANALDLENKLPQFVDKYKGKALKQSNSEEKLLLQPLKSIHLSSNLLGELEVNGNKKVIYFLILIAVLILVVAWVNYINLTTVTAMERAKEIGVRKVLSATSQQVKRQFLFESLIWNVLSFALAALLLFLVLPRFNTFVGRDVSSVILEMPLFWATFVISFIIVGTLCSGTYPAFFLSSNKLTTILKGKVDNANRGVGLRRSLVVFQFITAVVLMASTLVIYTQVQFMRQQDIGINIEQTIVISAPNVTDPNYTEIIKSFKTELLRFPSIESMTNSTEVPGQNLKLNGSVRLMNSPVDKINTYNMLGIDYDFLQAYNLKLLAGRGFMEDFGTDPGSVVINKSAASLLNFENPEKAIGEKILFYGEKEIVGVVEDYHHESLKKSYQPLIMYLFANGKNYISVKIKTSDLQGTVATLEKVWNDFFPGTPLNYFFLDDFFNKQYRADQQFGKIFGLFASLSIVVASLGLFGLSYFSALRRTKEIGIRKIHGAGIPTILFLLSKEFMILVMIANVIAWPLIYISMDSWLTEFPYRITVGWWMYLVPSLLVTIIALITVVFIGAKASRVNPINLLRYE